MLRVIFMGIGVVALILFVAWIFRDPIYLMVHQQSPVFNTPKGDEAAMPRPRRWVSSPQQ